MVIFNEFKKRLKVDSIFQSTKLEMGRLTVKYYTLVLPSINHAGGQCIAKCALHGVRTLNNIVSYLLSDHLGSTSLTTNSTGTVTSETRYTPWGDSRYTSGTNPTNYRFTGQRQEASFGLYFYNARWYDSALGRFAQADTIVPGGVQGLDRYAYSNNSPVVYVDPSGHMPCNGEFCHEDGYYSRPRPPKPEIVSREEWGATEPGTGNNSSSNLEGLWSTENDEGYKNYYLAGAVSLVDVLDTVVLHHEGDVATKDVKQVQDNEMNDGKYDVAYHFIIAPDGTIYEGRSIDVRGAHYNRQNTGKIGILWLGDFSEGDPNPNFSDGVDDTGGPTIAQIEATIKLIRWLDYMYGIENVIPHNPPGPEGVEFCPGKYATSAVELIQSLFSH